MILKRNLKKYVLNTYNITIYNFNRSCDLILARLRKRPGTSYPGSTGEPQSHIHQSRYFQGQTKMEVAAKVIGTKISGEKLEKQTQTRVSLSNIHTYTYINICMPIILCILYYIYTILVGEMRASCVVFLESLLT